MSKSTVLSLNKKIIITCSGVIATQETSEGSIPNRYFYTHKAGANRTLLTTPGSTVCYFYYKHCKLPAIKRKNK